MSKINTVEIVLVRWCVCVGRLSGCGRGSVSV